MVTHPRLISLRLPHYLRIHQLIYMYIIDSYSVYAASALGFMKVSRYCAAGGMTIVGIPFYQTMGVHWTLTILGCISALLVRVPYVFYVY